MGHQGSRISGTGSGAAPLVINETTTSKQLHVQAPGNQDCMKST